MEEARCASRSSNSAPRWIAPVTHRLGSNLLEAMLLTSANQEGSRDREGDGSEVAGDEYEQPVCDAPAEPRDHDQFPVLRRPRGARRKLRRGDAGADRTSSSSTRRNSTLELDRGSRPKASVTSGHPRIDSPLPPLGPDIDIL
jgi:hypothetical protein